jgi:ATP-binding cassette subfamily F protein uup
VDLDICLLIVSHDRYFMDKLCTKLLVFEGEGRIKEWVGSYTELRDRQREDIARGKGAKDREAKDVREEKEAKEVKVAKELPAKKKLTFAERLELQKIDKEMPKLEARKQELLVILAKGGTDHHAMMQQSMDLEKVMKELDRISDRWLELSERAEG